MKKTTNKNNNAVNSYVDCQHKTNESVQNTGTTVNVESINYEIPASSNETLSEEEILNGYRNGTIIPENNGKYWTNEDREKLASMFNNEVGITRMALDFKRKELAIMQQFGLLSFS